MLQAVSPQVSALHTHHRTKSSPDTLNVQNMSLAEGKSLVLQLGKKNILELYRPGMSSVLSVLAHMI